MTLSAQRHGDFPRSVLGSKLPVCWLRGRASPASCAVSMSAPTGVATVLPGPGAEYYSCGANEQAKHHLYNLVCGGCLMTDIAEGGMGRMSPVQLAPTSSAHGITVLLQVASSQANSSTQSFTASFRH